MLFKPEQKPNKDKQMIVTSSAPNCTKRNVIRRIGCLLFGHFKIKNKCQKCGEQFGVPKMDFPPVPP